MSFHRPPAAAQHRDALLDAAEDFVGGECLKARCGQFQGERKPVETAAELVELAKFVGGGCTSRDGVHPIDEEPGGR